MNGNPRDPARLPRRRNFAMTLLGMLAILVAACGTSPTAEPTAASSHSASPSSAAPSEASLPSMPPFDHGEIPAEIVGRYTFEVFDKESVIDLKSDGTYELGSGPIAFGVFTVQVTGEYGVFGDEMRFGNEVAVAGAGSRACTTGDGVYTWSYEGETLTFIVVDDPCPTDINRTAEWQSGWTRVD